MNGILNGYDVNDQTWFYLSLLLIIAVYFRFGRLWSLRNFDLVLLLSFSPGLLIVEEHPPAGYVWLFVVTLVLLLRLFADGVFQRRPRMEQNLNVPGLAFLCFCAFAILTTRVITEEPAKSSVETVRRGTDLLNRYDASATRDQAEAGPASSLLAAPVAPLANAVAAGNDSLKNNRAGMEFLAARILAVMAHLAVVLGLVVVGRLHFSDTHLGVAMATLYLLLPCTAYDVSKVNHVLPAALIVWAFVFYRRPMAAGGLMGLACGTLFFPVFLLPLWAAFYGRRNAVRFGLALGLVGAVLLGSLVLTSADTYSLKRQLIGSINWQILEFRGGTGEGFWSTYDPAYKIPVFTAFLIMLVTLTIWPRRKTVEHLMAHSTAIVVATQLWYPQQGGVYLLWYLPLLLMVIFRPRLAHLVPPAQGYPAERPKSEPRPRERELVHAGANGNGHFPG